MGGSVQDTVGGAVMRQMMIEIDGGLVDDVRVISDNNSLESLRG